MEATLKLEGGSVVDGTGSAAFAADVAVRGNEIVAVGDLDGVRAARTIDCKGRFVVPGFIDIHSHSDFLVPGSDHGRLLEPFVRQGMTTLVGGNCGFSPGPISEHTRGPITEASLLIGDEAIDLRWETLGEFLDALDKDGVAMNVAQLVGHGSVRAAVSGHLNPSVPTPDELAQMERLSRQALDDGCVGISTGLGYPPGIFARENELAAFASWAREAGKIFTSHLRAYSWVSPVYKTDPATQPHNLAAIEEILRVAELARARLQISHLIFVGQGTWPTAERAIALIEEARSRGIDVAFDAFPYTAGNTTASVIFPPEVLPFLENVLSSPEQMEGLVAIGNAVFDQIGFHLEDIQIMNANAAAFERYNGWFCGEAARDAGMSVWEFYARMVMASHRNARVLIHKYSGDASDESALEAVLRHPLCTIETDTFVTACGHQNPASYGTFPRVLHTYVKRGLFPLEEAVRKMTGAAADRLGWSDRGFVRKGCAADLVVIDPATLADTATFQKPSEFPRGIEHVFIGGRHVVEGDRYDADAKAGTVIRR
ncbi:MAG TPA: amidohydrolase family protein [Candidatus Binatia bacterium]|nr:amidohydrolase family protein [Candidatus Binatia bacterium]